MRNRIHFWHFEHRLEATANFRKRRVYGRTFIPLFKNHQQSNSSNPAKLSRLCCTRPVNPLLTLIQVLFWLVKNWKGLLLATGLKNTLVRLVICLVGWRCCSWTGYFFGQLTILLCRTNHWFEKKSALKRYPYKHRKIYIASYSEKKSRVVKCIDVERKIVGNREGF